MTLTDHGWNSEYLYRKLFALTHDQYMQEPSGAVQWMVRIDDIYSRVDRERKAAGT